MSRKCLRRISRGFLLLLMITCTHLPSAEALKCLQRVLEERDLPGARCTWVVPAAPSGAAPHPAAFVHRNGPLVDLVVLQSVGRQVADLDLRVVLLEVLEGHPAGTQTRRLTLHFNLAPVGEVM